MLLFFFFHLENLISRNFLSSYLLEVLFIHLLFLVGRGGGGGGAERGCKIVFTACVH